MGAKQSWTPQITYNAAPSCKFQPAPVPLPSKSRTQLIVNSVIITLLVLILVAVLVPRAHAQESNFFPTGSGISAYTVATLPVGSDTGTLAIVTNGTGYSCTVGGGATLVLCYYNGAAWSPVGSAGGTGCTSPGVVKSVLYDDGAGGCVDSSIIYNAGVSVDATGLRHIAAEYDSDVANGATNGTIRFAKSDFQAWRNNANGANLSLGINASDQLVWNTTNQLLTLTLANVAHKWLNSYDQTTGVFTQTQPTLADIAAGIAPAGSFDFTATTPTVPTQSASDNSTKAASTAYVTTGIANAIAAVNPATAVQAATTAAANTSGFTYNNGASGIGATFTGSVNTAITIDGYTFTAVGQRLLVKNDTQAPSGAFNGVYYVTQIQTAILAPILTRALDYDMPSDINNTGTIPVINGTVNIDTSWLLTSQVTTVGTDALTYVQFSVNPSTILTAAAALTTGNVVKAAGNDRTTVDSGIAAANLVTAASNYTNGDVVQAAGANKTTSDAGFLATDVVRKDTTNTGAVGMTLNMAASTTANALRVPNGAGLTSGADGAIAYDTTSKTTHIRTNAADSIAAATTATSTTTTNVLHATATAGVYTASAVVDADIPAAITRTIANGTSALGTGAISSGACATVVTTSATNTATTDDIIADFNADPTGVTGYAASANGMLTIIKYPTTNNVNFKVCNNTASSVTPGAITLNWRVVR